MVGIKIKTSFENILHEVRLKMAEIRIQVPDNIPLSVLKKRIEEIVRDEELKWALFEKAKEEIALTDDDLEELERVREDAWREIKKKYGL